MNATDTRRRSQSYTCALPGCGEAFTAFQSDRPGELAYCCKAHASRHREQLKGHGSTTLPCGTCGAEVTRPNSRLPKAGGTFYCSRQCFWERDRNIDGLG